MNEVSEINGLKSKDSLNWHVRQYETQKYVAGSTVYQSEPPHKQTNECTFSTTPSGVLQIRSKADAIYPILNIARRDIYTHNYI